MEFSKIDVSCLIPPVIQVLQVLRSFFDFGGQPQALEKLVLPMDLAIDLPTVQQILDSARPHLSH